MSQLRPLAYVTAEAEAVFGEWQNFQNRILKILPVTENTLLHTDTCSSASSV